ncbi:hypothetical protein [Streptococcus sp.]|uniref:hypothetical protein n=1 Tax=Streptococcus sp. TaxID=1306 RepID=UPI002911AF71|nr:hypothetical protein [Streptococcus sp.]MDU6444694.1 hypothetical protein [Streptococcus sp.]MDU6639104.1 hypothetical protein [Streptococcus sp.]
MEIVMDIETLEIFEVIDSDKQDVEDTAEEIIEEDTLMETSERGQCLEEPRRIVQLTLFDDSFYPHPFMFFEDSS